MSRQVLFDALDQMCRDQEFATLAASAADKAPDLVIAYLRRRGVGEIDAALTAIAYMAGVRHTLRWTDREVIDQIRSAM